MNILPIMAAINKALPESTRVNTLAKDGAPKSSCIVDWHDHFGENPYKIEPIVEGKIWSVQRKTEDFFTFGAGAEAMMTMMGLAFTREETRNRVKLAAEAHGEEAAKLAAKDLEWAQEMSDLVEKKGKTEETLKAVGPHTDNMLVAKLNNGDVMLYSPVRVREEHGFAEWLESIGPVKWLVLGSSSHTMEVQSVLERYPDATCIAAQEVFLKLQYTPGVTKKQPDYDYTNPEQLQKVNELLADIDVRLHYIDGDCATNALVAIVHKTALEVDLMYSRCDGGWMDESLEKLLSSEGSTNSRLIKWALASSPTSPNNALPPYRFWMMDPTNAMSALMISQPKKDGSSCKDMARSLRLMLSDDFDQAAGVHFCKMDRETFRKSIDLNWNWLDGSSLL